MIRISHKKLEAARKDPSILKPGREPEPYKGGGPSGMQYFKWALQKFVHVDNRDDAKAHEYIESSLVAGTRTVNGKARRKFSDKSVEKYVDYLGTYLAKMPKERPVRFQDQLKLNIDDLMRVGGMIDRIDLVANGYSIWVFEKDPIDGWEDELRFPLFQQFYAEQLGSSVAEVSVGVYVASSGEHLAMSFTAKEIAAAAREVQALVKAALK